MALFPLAENSFSQQEITAVKNQLDSGWLTMGKHVGQFEAEFSEHVGRKHSIMVNSGSSANLLIAATLFLQQKKTRDDRDVVIVPNVGWSTTYSPFYFLGYKFIFCDVNENDFNINTSLLNEALCKFSGRVAAVCVVNVLGWVADLKKIRRLCDEHRAMFIVDNCESLGGIRNDYNASAFSDMTSHSFYFSHHIQTIEGGMVCTDDDELYDILTSIRAHGWDRHKLTKNSNDPHTRFDQMFSFVYPGFNVRPMEISGLLGLKQLRRVDDANMARRHNLLEFENILRESSLVPIKGTGTCSPMALNAIAPSSAYRRRLIEECDKVGVEIRPYVAGCISKHTVFTEFYANTICETFPSNIDEAVSTEISEKGFYFGNFPRDMTNELSLVKNVFRKIS